MIAGLPYDAEVEYLESTGTQYIDTGIVPTIDTSAEMDVMEISWGGWAVFLGSATSDNNADSWYFRTGGDGPDYSFTIDSKFQNNAIHVALGTRFVATVSKAAITVNGVTKVVGALEYSSQPVLPMYLFACNLNGVAWGNRQIKGRVYSCKIISGATTVRDFLPVRFTNELGQPEGAMYDRVSRKLFRNAGTGAFTIGPDVATPVMGLHFMRRPRYTAKDYVRDGLVAMWDGIENSGWGVHDPNAAVWKDLMGGIPYTGTNLLFESSAVVSDGGGSEANTFSFSNYISYDRTKEIVIQPISISFTNDSLLRSTGEASLDFAIWGERTPSLDIFVRNGAYIARLPSSGAYQKMSISAAYSQSGTQGYLNGEKTLDVVSIFPPQGNMCFPALNTNNKARMYSIRIYNRALTAEEIAHNHAVDKERFNLP